MAPNAHRNVFSSFKRLLCLKPCEGRASGGSASSSRAKKNPAITSSPLAQCSVCQKERSRASPRRSSPRAAGWCVVCLKERRRENSVSTSSAAAAAAAVVSSSISRRPSKLLRIASKLLGRLSSNSRVAIDDYVWALDSVDVAHIDPPLPVVRKPASAAAGTATSGGGLSLWERRRGKDRLRDLKLH